tara:strand:- start:1408 stop:2142 length:735 start_codon:yes stop_codon:yes gene_type:complete
MNPINFVPPDSDLLSWKKDNSLVFGEYVEKNSSIFGLKQRILIPWAVAALTLAGSWIVPFLGNRSAASQVSSLEFEHSQFLQLTARISAAEQSLDQQKNDIRDFSVLFTSSSLAYPFTFYLQRSIPSEVSLSSFVLDRSDFNLCAFGPNYQALEDLIDLIKAMPSVDADTVRFTNMSSDPSTLGSSASCQSLSPLQPVSAFIKGSFLSSTPSDLQELYSGASDYSQYNKLKLYNSLMEKIGGNG